MPAVSIIMPCFNGARTLEQAVRSAIAQTYPDWELIAVDNGSTDASPGILSGFAQSDDRIRILTIGKPSGASAARNHGLAHARGRYFAFLDADDAWYPRKLKVQVEAMARCRTALLCSAYDVMDYHGAVRGAVTPPPGTFTYRSMLAYNPVGTLTAMLDRELCGDIRFSPDLATSEDFQLWLSILKRGFTGVCLPDTLAIYRASGNTLSSNKLFAARNRWRVYREFEEFSWPASTYLMAVYAVTGAWKTFRMHSSRTSRSMSAG